MSCDKVFHDVQVLVSRVWMLLGDNVFHFDIQRVVLDNLRRGKGKKADQDLQADKAETTRNGMGQLERTALGNDASRSSVRVL
ncbi:hypothetical protein ElyMa_001840800 [Elysia marginata]|uniref:Uncharacterized protein n=1 Tax=Elysia marginata TaxID=1093978 RepID=A0AAV4EKC6_9GAST|nr:hypothetical protein ElyMa_001840800 [Elysia marginata]